MALIRVPQGAPPPGADECRKTLRKDHGTLRSSNPNGTLEIEISGPYPISLDGNDFDEYVVWER